MEFGRKYSACLLFLFSHWLFRIYGKQLFIINGKNLDNMDGKQARNTKNSSPLGLLFDHGIDSINCSLLICTIPSVFQIGPTNYFLLFACSLFIGFFYATLEQYYIGGLFLPAFNGVSDGAVILIVFELISGFTGIDFHYIYLIGCHIWKMPIYQWVTLGHLVVSFVVVGIYPTLFSKYNICYLALALKI